MLFDFLFSDLSFTEIIKYVVFSLCAVIITLSLHELSHGLVAYALGDDTAKKAGRLTLNPLAHIHPMGFIMLLLFGFGWAKPVPIRARNFKNVRVGIILTAIAGPLCNFLIGFFSILIWLGIAISFNGEAVSVAANNISIFFSILSSVSVGLGVFNLIPFPPLDGSKIIGELLPMKWRYKYYSLEKYSSYIFIGIIILLDRFNFISIAVNFVMGLFIQGAAALLSLF